MYADPNFSSFYNLFFWASEGCDRQGKDAPPFLKPPWLLVFAVYWGSD